MQSAGWCTEVNNGSRHVYDAVPPIGKRCFCALLWQLTHRQGRGDFGEYTDGDPVVIGEWSSHGVMRLVAK